MPFEKLDRPFVFDSLFAGVEGAEIAPFARLRIFFARIEAIFARG
jgi:hypothetical protein